MAAKLDQLHNWTPDRVEKLKKLVAEGLSAGEIAPRLNAGFTRNAVIGKATRLGLSFARGARRQPLPQRLGYRSGIAARPTRVQDRKPRLKPVAELSELAEKMKASGGYVAAPKFNPEPYVPAVVELPAEPLNIGLLDLEQGMCKFPTTADTPHLFCGLPIVKGRPYCSSHTAACFVRGSYIPRSLMERAA